MSVFLLPGVQGVAHARELASFGALSDNSLTPHLISDKAGIPLEVGVPEVFSTNGSQASRYPGGFTTVPGPFDDPSEGFDSITIVLAAHNSAPASGRFTARIVNATTGELITETPSGVEIRVDDVPLDSASPSDPASEHCEGDTAGTTLQITLAPPVNEVMVGPSDNLQLIVTPVAIFGGNLDICTDFSGFHTSMGLQVEPIVPPNQPPAAVNDSATTAKNTPVTVDLLSNDSDPDGDALSVTNLTTASSGGVADNGDGTVAYTPTAGFTGVDTFTYTANDGTDDGNIATVTITVLNRPPDCGAAASSVDTIKARRHSFVAINVLGVSDPDGDPVSVTIEGIRQDEPTDERGDGAFAPDGRGVGSDTASVRAERSGIGDGRVYQIAFRADDGDGGSCTGLVQVTVPHDVGAGSVAVDGGALYDSTI